MGIQHYDKDSNNHYKYEFPENNNVYVNPLIGQRHMFKMVAPLITPQNPGISHL